VPYFGVKWQPQMISSIGIIAETGAWERVDRETE
jgi:hypothetical protein